MSIIDNDNGNNLQHRVITIPQNRISPLKRDWKQICETVVNEAKIDIRYNVSQKCVEIRTNQNTASADVIEKVARFLEAYGKGFELRDATAFLKVENLMVDTFDIQNVKLVLQGDHLSRAIGRIAGSGGKVKHTIENATKTRIQLCDKTVHIMGTAGCVKIARDAICDLILGADPAKVYQRLRVVASRFNSSE
ncbi:Partner_of Nob1 [Hexamita inflata]|uniref:Partner of Nob1 n=1 Tax=Hexamita inflata TaxID=28002 RepID=A0AA86Q631_9EUKA|nr:Partner of Nob1 [Hexamita inflata]CAI9951246.1 Partner of Nob1 [Hexamita inflata]